jgi:hypothetical protein
MAWGAPGRGNKYHARKTEYPAGSGEWYDSKGEADYAAHLDLLQLAGKIKDWQRGRVWVLVDAPKKRDRITLKPDFEVWGTDGSFRCVDFKGMVTDVFRLKAKIWRAVHPTIPLTVVKADGLEVAA